MNSTQNNSCPSPAYSTTKYFKIPLYSIVLAVGLPLTCLALWVLVTQLKRSVILSVYILNLLLANFLQILMLPFGMFYSYSNHAWSLGTGMCGVVSVAFFTNFYAKNCFLCLIAMERYLGLVHPLRFRGLQSMPGAIKLSILTWLMVAALCSVSIWLQIKDELQGRCLDESQENKDYAYFKMATMGLTFLIPCFLIGFFYFRVLFELRKMASLERRTKRQIFTFVSMMVASFLLLNIPFQVTSFYKYYWEVKLRAYEQLCFFRREIFIYSQTTLCLATLSNILDPLFYNLLLEDVRAKLKNILGFNALGRVVSHMWGQQQELPLRLTTGEMKDQLGT